MENDKLRIKLNSSLEFGEGEQEVYDFVAELTQKRKLTSTLMTLIRAYVNNPDIFEPLMKDADIQQTIGYHQEVLAKLGANQEAFQKECRAKLDLLATRLLTLEEQLSMLHSLLESRKFIGLSQRVEAVYCAEVLTKQKVRELGQELGFNVTTEKSKDLRQQTEDTLAYMIEHYDGALTELKSLASPPVMASYAPTDALNTRNYAMVQAQEETATSRSEPEESFNATGTTFNAPSVLEEATEQQGVVAVVGTGKMDEEAISQQLFEEMFG